MVVPQYFVILGYGIGYTVRAALAGSLLFGPVVGLAFGMPYACVTAIRRKAFEPSCLQLRRPNELRRTAGHRGRRFGVWFQIGLLGGFVIALGVGFATGLERTLIWGPAQQGTSLDRSAMVGILLYIPIFGSSCGLAFGAVAALETPVDLGSAATPSSLLAANRTTVLRQITMLVPILTLAITFGGPLWTHALQSSLGQVDWSLERGVFVGLEGGLAGVGSYALAFTAWGQWLLVTRMVLPLTGRLPWAPMDFLEDAYRRGVLRQSGAVYQFRHARLQAHLSRAAE